MIQEITPTEDRPVVLISYSQENPGSTYIEKARGLAASLTRDGVDVRIDLTKESADDWITWMGRQVEEADFVLCMINASYRNRFDYRGDPDQGTGLGWEAGLIKRELYSKKWQNTRFLPCFFHKDEYKNIPIELTGYDNYLLVSEAGYEKLLRKIFGKPQLTLSALGSPPELTTTEVEPLFPSPTAGPSSADETQDRQITEPGKIEDGQIKVFESLLARLDREKQRKRLRDFLAEGTGSGRYARIWNSLAAVAVGSDLDSIKTFALCCLDTFADCLMGQSDEALLDLLENSDAISLRSDSLRGGTEQLRRKLDAEIKVVPDTGWVVLYSTLKSFRQATTIAKGFVQWRKISNNSGCRRKVVLVLIIEAGPLGHLAQWMWKVIPHRSSSERLCQLGRLAKVSGKHILSWRTYLTDRNFPHAHRLGEIVDRIYENQQPSLLMLTIKDRIIERFEKKDLHPTEHY